MIGSYSFWMVVNFIKCFENEITMLFSLAMEERMNLKNTMDIMPSGIMIFEKSMT
jgi:hypothetical protein